MQVDEDRGRATEIFLRARELEQAARAAFLDDACSDDVALRREVESLLAYDGGTDPSLGAVGDPTAFEVPSVPGYRVLEMIGVGGMGEVWLGRQDGPVRLDVAIKVIKAGMDTRHLVARFENERHTLALMEHSGIAKIYTAGATARGLPFFAMEFVRGETITAYADRHQMAISDRLSMFLDVCSAVQHAHQKGVTHRDLKPSNVLVTVEGERPVPRIIDFGIAKVTAPSFMDRTLLTEAGIILGTPEYMSPEQTRGNGGDVDTRSDVYSLGVILYELLVGTLPIDPIRLRGVDHGEMCRRIREDEPETPSSRVSSMGGVASAASQRHTEPRTLRRQLRGDLDWITMRALEKDRDRRYQSVSDLAADLERHIAHQPVLAGPPSALYRLGKFARRHRVGVSVAAVALTGTLGFVVALARQTERLAEQRNRAEAVSKFLGDLFFAVDPNAALGKEPTAREVLDRAAPRIEKELSGQPEVQAQLYNTLGSVYLNLGHFSEAARFQLRSVELRRDTLGPQHRSTLTSKYDLALVYHRLRRLSDAEALLREVLEVERKIKGNDHRDTMWTETMLAGVVNSQARFAESERLHKELLPRQRRVLGEDHPQTLASLNNLGNALGAQGKLGEAEAAYRSSMDRHIRTLGTDHPHTLIAMQNVAESCRKRKDYDEAERIHREVLERRKRVLGLRHRDTWITLYSLAEVESERGRRHEALDWFRQAVESGMSIDNDAEMASVLVPLHGDRTFEALARRAVQNASTPP